jgi:hypothetical protein
MTGRHEELMAGWLDASLTPAEQEELLTALRADEGLAREFAEEVELHRGLQFASSQSEAGDRRAADRILHYVRASQEGTKFVDGVRARALRRAHPGTSRFGPVLAIAAATMVATLIGLMAWVSHRHRQAARESIVERTEAVEREEAPKQVREVPKSEAPKPVEDEAARKKRIEEELRSAAGTKRETPPKPETPKDPAPEEKPIVTPEPKVDPPKTTKVEAPPALARLENVQGERGELRDGAVVEGSAVIRFLDGTRIELSGEATLQEKLTGKRASGKGLTLARGSLTADVAKQPAGTAFLFVTPHAEVQVVGTRLSIQSGAETRVDVQEGQVRVTSLKGGQMVTVAAGQGSDVGPSGAPRPFLQGLRALYFDQNNLKGQVLERVDAGVNLFLDSAKNELPPVGSDRNFAARWEGRFLAETAGEYVFVLSVDGQVKFTFDGQDLVSDPRGAFHPIAKSVIRRTLAAGWHDLTVDYADDSGSSRCELRYIAPGAPPPADGMGYPIPQRLFTHNRR